MSEQRKPSLRAENIVKRFGAIMALDGVSLELAAGRNPRHPRRQRRRQIDADQDPHRLSAADLGRLSSLGGKEVALRSVDHARSLGIECVYQDLALVNSLSVYHNMFLNRETRIGSVRAASINRAMRRRAAEALDDIGVNIPSVDLPRWSGCRAASARRSRWRARSIPMRASCCWTSRWRRWARARPGLIIDLILRLKAKGGLSIAMIMHNYAQTLEIADRIILMQHGRITYEKPRPQPRWRN